MRRATTLGALAGGPLADIDAVTYLWGADSFHQVHQFYTHNLIALLVLPAVAGALFTAAFQRDRVWFFVAAWVGMAFHLAGDLIGLWPVPLLYPFSDLRLAFFLLEQDFSLALDVVLVLGAVSTFWDPIAAGIARVRLVFGATLVLAAVAVVLS